MNHEPDFTYSALPAAHYTALPAPLLEWQDEYSVGVGVLDEDHRHTFHLLNRLHEALLVDQGCAAMRSLIDELIDHMRQHFAGEELLMQAFAYPEALVHELEHERLLRVLLEFREQFAEGRDQLVAPLVEFTEGWIIRHILTIDRRYSAFFAERGAKP